MNRPAQLAITSSRESARTRGSTLAAALAASLLAVVASAILLPARAEAAAPPRDFMGVTAWDDIGDRDFAKLAGSNVRLYRMDVLWNQVEPRPPRSDGTHVYEWRYYDRMFRTAARHGVRILPILQGSPRWAASRPQIQPRTTVGKAAFAAFAREAGKRYGPTGTLWTRTPWSRTSPAPSRLRALYWQVWNEPNTPDRWTPGPRPREYATMLKRVSKALNVASPSVQVMSGGLVWPSRGMNPEPFLAHVLQVTGAREGG